MRDFSVIAIFERKFFYMSEEIEIKDEVLDLKVTETYDENQIQVLEGLEAVRKRPGMYIGSTSARGLHHLVYEIVDNSIDEALAGYCTHIEVTIEKGDIIRVTDNGRGIPCGIHPQMGIPTLEVVLTVLHAGGKFDGSGYKVSGGLHGVGSSVVNALSDWLEAEVRDGHTKHYMRFERGVTTVKMRDTPCESETGTTIRFHADPEIFETTVYEYDVLEKRLREQAFLNAGLKITLRDERDDEPVEEVMHYEGGIRFSCAKVSLLFFPAKKLSVFLHFTSFFTLFRRLNTEHIAVKIEYDFYFLTCGSLVDHHSSHIGKQCEIDGIGIVFLIMGHTFVEIIVIAASNRENPIIFTHESGKPPYSIKREPETTM